MKYLAVPRRSSAKKSAPARAPAKQRQAGPETLGVLRVVAELGAGHDFAPATSGEVARRLGVSQQTASRRLVELVRWGLVERRLAARKPLLKVTAAGLDALRGELERYRAAVEGPRPLTVRGKVSSGLGEGRWYISRTGYQTAMVRLLGFAPFPGTLNLSLEGPEAEKIAELRAREGLLIEEFQDEGRTFGAVKCFPARLHGVEVAAIFPLRGHHRDVLEVVAAVSLREKLALRDGDEALVEIRVP